ncbi:hypothetical protein ACW95P_03630 [Candidatus Mycoplasma pogonae]
MDKNKFKYDFNDLTYITFMKKERKFSKVIKSLAFYFDRTKFNLARRSSYKWKVYWVLANVPNLKINFHFSKDTDQWSWIYKNTLNQLFDKNVLEEKNFLDNLIKLSHKYKID